jgi:YidC/Oxa1 family membrane protein insertase
MVPGVPAPNVRADRRLGLERLVELELTGAPFTLAPGAESAFAYRVYLGPKHASALAPVGAHLERVVDYGWFSVIARPLLAFLNALYAFIGNYGIAIILLTTLVKAVFWPLSAKSFKSMQKMKDLQPKLQKLKERYGKDRERLNMEVMQLYKTHKVNPMGGCLPMLVQIPVFFALYRVLLGSIELRHAPFFLWIQDLSAKDPYYVTPLVMGVTMFLQQKMAPATGMDEMQQKLMLYGMPAIFTFMFLNFPSGLVIYWLVNNVLSIAQQYWMLRQSQQAT